MKKILIFSHEWPPFIGGVGTVGYQIAKWYSSHGHQVEVVTRKNDSISLIDNVKFHVVETLPYFWFLSYRKYFKENINLDDFDVFLLNECAPAISSVGIFSDEHYKKSYVLVHGLEIENLYNNTFKNCLRKLFFFRHKHRVCCNKSKMILFVSNFMKNKFIENTSPHFISKSGVFNTGIDKTVFFNKGKNFCVDKLSVVSASRITEMKGYKELFFSMKRVMESQPNIIWNVCGDGDFLPQLRELARKSSIKNRVIFHGACERNKLNRIYASNDIYVLLSKYDEALPLSYVEAQLSGLYAIGLNKGGVVETIQNNKTGSLIESPDDLSDLLKDISLGLKVLPSRESIAKDALVFDMDTRMDDLSEFIL